MQTIDALSSTLHVELGPASAPLLIRWSTWERSTSIAACTQESFALLTEDGPVLVDPDTGDASSLERIVTLLGGLPVATLLATGMHERSCYALRERWGIPVWAPRTAAPLLEGSPDHLYDAGDILPGGVRASVIRGPFPGEHILAWTAPTGERVLFTADGIQGPSNPANSHAYPYNWRHSLGVYVGAAPIYYMLVVEGGDPQALRADIATVLETHVDLLCGAHSLPLRASVDAPEGPHVFLTRIVELDWASLTSSRQPPMHVN
jgi:hypothetical protein